MRRKFVNLDSQPVDQTWSENLIERYVHKEFSLPVTPNDRTANQFRSLERYRVPQCPTPRITINYQPVPAANVALS